jgi:phosphohistidine phosphatase
MKWVGPDDVRPLSEKGRLQAERLGLLLADAAFEPDAILSSPKLRALDTARLVATPLGMPVRVVEELGGPLDIESVEALLTAHGSPRQPLLVGHDPDFSELAAALIGVAELPLRKGTLIRIDLTSPLAPGAGILRWMLPPELLGPIS